MSEIAIPHSRPFIGPDDVQAVARVLASGRLVQGEQVHAFEEEVSALIGVGHAAALSSGTAALHLALLSLGVGEGDEVIIPSYVCAALLHAIRHVRAVPVIADIEADTFNISLEDVKKRLTGSTRAIIVPHMFGLPADLDGITSLGIPVIEDCAQSIGSRYQGVFTGRKGVLSVYSFYATKMITTGEGGMVVSDRGDLIGTIRDLRDYDEREHDRLRFNCKMTDLQAALGRSQLKKLPMFLQRRREIAGRYSQELAATGFQVPVTPPGREHAYYRYVVLLDRPGLFLERIRAQGIECRRAVFKPLHEYLGLPGYAVTRQIQDRAVSIPIYPSLADDTAQSVIEKIKEAASEGGARV